MCSRWNFSSFQRLGSAPKHSGIGDQPSQHPAMITSASVLGITGLLAAAALAFPSVAPEVSSPGVPAKADRAVVGPFERNCSQQVWPNFEVSCLRSHKSVVPARRIALITAGPTDRTPITRTLRGGT